MFMIRALEKSGNQIHLYYPKGPLFQRVIRIAFRLYALTNSNSSMFFNSRLYALLLAQYFKWFKAIGKCDVVFISRGSAVLAFTDFGKIPVVYTSDATFRLLSGYNDNYKNCSPKQLAEGDLLERRAVERAAAVFYPSEWAAVSAVRDYGVPPAKVAVVPSGANNGVYVDVDVRELAKNRLSSNVCRLLFVGKSWSGKGGPIAVAATRFLRERGINATLTIVGCHPEECDREDWLEVIAEINKNQPGGVEYLNSLFEMASFFILPTRNETFGLVFAEACSYGLPIVATLTGGVPTSVVDGLNGYLLSADDTGSGYAKKIESLWNDSNAYLAFSFASRRRYEEVLNWDSWGVTVQKLITTAANADQAVGEKPARD